MSDSEDDIHVTYDDIYKKYVKADRAERWRFKKSYNDHFLNMSRRHRAKERKQFRNYFECPENANSLYNYSLFCNELLPSLPWDLPEKADFKIEPDVKNPTPQQVVSTPVSSKQTKPPPSASNEASKKPVTAKTQCPQKGDRNTQDLQKLDNTSVEKQEPPVAQPQVQGSDQSTHSIPVRTPPNEESGSNIAGIPRKMMNLFKSRLYSDFIIRVEGTDIPVHKCILAISSKVFEAMFASGMTEVEIHDFKVNTVQAMVKFLYAGIVEHPSVALALNLIRVSDTYALTDLKHWCNRYLQKHLNVKNALQFLVAAHDFKNIKLKVKCLEFVIQNRQQIDLNGHFQEVSEECSDGEISKCSFQKVLEQRNDLATELVMKMWK